jgi:phosphonate transport system substrate-binding protein
MIRLLGYALFLFIIQTHTVYAESHNLHDFWQLFRPNIHKRYQPTFSKENIFKSQHYIIGIHPLHNPKRLFEIYAPLVDLLNVQIPNAIFVLEASRNYAEFEKKLYAEHFDLALPNPYQTINALKHHYHVFGKMGDDDNFRGIILVRRDSHIQKVSDLKGKAVSYPAPTALAATLMPQYYLHTHGLDVNRDIENKYVGSQESSILNVLQGYVAAGATWPVPWKAFIKEHPDLAKQLTVKWQTEPLLNNSWMVHQRVPADIPRKVAVILFNLQNQTAGQLILQHIPLSRFEAANDKTYQPVQQFLNQFSKTVGPLAD